MANEHIPEFQTTMLPILQYFSDGKPRNSKELYADMAEYYKMTEEDLKIKVPSGVMGLFKNRIAWAVSYLKNAGLLFYPQRRVYQITELGKDILTRGLTHINIPYLKTLEPFQQWQAKSVEKESRISTSTPTVVESESTTPDEVIGITMDRLHLKLQAELLDLIKSKSASFFEDFVLQLLNGMGYGGVEAKSFEVTGQSGDFGIDGVIYQDKLGIERIYVQAKRWKESKVSSKEVRDFIGSLSLRGTNKGVFITTSEFTPDAKSASQMNPHNRIILIDGTQLADFAIAHNVGVQVKRQFEIKDIDSEFFEE